MRELWKALVARMIFWLTPKPPAPVIVAAPETPMKPGKCECSHERCAHVGGKGRCVAEYPPDKVWLNGAICSCQIYIPSKDDDDDGEDDPETPSPAELERLWQK